MTLKETIQNDVKAAMKAKDQPQLNALRLITAAIKQKEVDERVDVTDADVLTILDKMGKQRRDSIEQYQKADRQDLVKQEQYELDLLARYLPTPLSPAEISTLMDAAMIESGAVAVKDMGKVMQLLKPKCQGRADLTQISAMVKAHLEALSH